MSTPKVTGPQLEEAVRTLIAQGKSGRDVAFETGYTRTNRKSGEVLPDITGLNRALNEARGLVLVKTRAAAAPGTVKVSKSHQLTLGKAHLAKIGALPGMAFRTEVLDGRLTIIPDETAAAQAPLTAPAMQQPVAA
jgi:hypothetical protein